MEQTAIEKISNRKNKAMTATKKIELYKNESAIQDSLDDFQYTANLVEKLLLHYEDNKVHISDAEFNALIQSNFTDERIKQLAEKRAENSQRKDKESTINSFIDDVYLFRSVFAQGLVILSSAVSVKDGRTVIDPEAIKAITERHTYFIEDEKEIELYNEHQDVIKRINDFREKYNNTMGYGFEFFQLIQADREGKASRPETIRYSR